MRKLTTSKQHCGYFMGETTSGSTDNIYITDGSVTVMLEDCLIWEDENFNLADFDKTVADCKADEANMRELGWTIVEEQV
jgi:hypothetical protein